MVDLWLDRISRQPRVMLVKGKAFYSKKIEVSKEIQEAATRIATDYAKLENWMEETYSKHTPKKPFQADFPKELLRVKKKQEKKPSKASGSEERVRTRSVGDAESGGSEV